MHLSPSVHRLWPASGHARNLSVNDSVSYKIPSRATWQTQRLRAITPQEATRKIQCKAVLLQVFMSARRHLGEILSAFEFLDRQALAMTLEQLPNIQDPLPGTEARSATLEPAPPKCSAATSYRRNAGFASGNTQVPKVVLGMQDGQVPRALHGRPAV